jgi:glycosyltransferase involved in cell wall biosynthesis
MALLGKVLIIVENLPVPFDRRVWMEATTLSKTGYQVSVICPKGKGFDTNYEVIDDIHIYRHPMPPDISSILGYLTEYSSALFWEFLLSWRVWRKQGFDIIHICNPPDLLFLVASFFKAFMGVRIVFDHHDINLEMYEAKYGRKDLFYYALALCEKLTFSLADIVISTNQSYRDIAISRGGRNSNDVFIVRSGPDLSIFKTLPLNVSLKKGREYLVGYVGVMGEPEGIDLLLKAIHHIVYKLNRNDICFVLIGSGPMYESLKKLSKDLNIDDFAEFTGRISDKDLLEYLSTCDVCVNPDKKIVYNELSTMNKIMEYMAMGKPIVQFDLLEGRRSAEGASLYAEGNDFEDFAAKIVYLLDNPQLRDEMGHLGRQRMENDLEWKHQAPKLIDAYSKLSHNQFEN